MAFGDPTPGFSVPVITPGSGFNAMMTRFYDEFGNVQNRNEKAFGYYEDEKWREADMYNRAIREQELERQRQRTAEIQRQQDMARQRQEQRQRESRAAGVAQRNDPQRRFFQTRNALDAMTQHGRVMPNMSGDNPQFQNFPAAAALTYGQNIFPNGFQTYADMLKAGFDPEKGPIAQAAWGQTNTGNPDFWGGYGESEKTNKGFK